MQIDQIKQELKAQSLELQSAILSNPYAEKSQRFRDEQALLFDCDWSKRDRAGYDAHVAKCEALDAERVACKRELDDLVSLSEQVASDLARIEASGNDAA